MDPIFRPLLCETIFIHFSEEDNCWIGHGLRTDQIGTGDCMLDALTDVLSAIDQILSVVRDDPTIATLREAPSRIQKMADSASVLPREIFQIARRRAHEQWPAELSVNVSPTKNRRFVTKVLKEETC